MSEPQKTPLNVFNCWNSYNPLDGMPVSSLDELREHVPEHSIEGEVVKKLRLGTCEGTQTGYDVYGREKAQMRDAHGCPVCDKIVIGSPSFEPYSDIRGPRAGTSGYLIRCANRECGAVLSRIATTIY
jgi:hypothetical protein